MRERGGGEGKSINEVTPVAIATAGPLPQPLSRPRERGANQQDPAKLTATAKVPPPPSR
ncbi:hypothetical protein CBM2586_B30015 [Cupriavidus phytorum]|uniref:Uncharacterized protein n=1 Tax=Cupriavidus taiwanensis TaxID=164546 RepID=A0A375CKP4_9BURK|nr:hypothetical protein CBM2586_B30015 [Cupriavidus taiwanensis]